MSLYECDRQNDENVAIETGSALLLVRVMVGSEDSNITASSFAFLSAEVHKVHSSHIVCDELRSFVNFLGSDT